MIKEWSDGGVSSFRTRANGNNMSHSSCTNLWSPEFSESVDRQSIHQLATTCKTNKKTTVVFCCPFDGKVSLFLEDLELRAAVISIKNLLPHLV